MASSTPKVALITGGSKGIGAGIATLLGSQGWAVVVTYSSDAGAADKLVQQLGEKSALAVKSDAGSVSDIDKLLETVIRRFGRLDAVIASAGWLPYMTPDKVAEKDWERAFGLNAKGPYFLIQKAAPHLPDGTGRVILFSTSQTVQTTVTPDYLLYIATKGAVEQMVRGWAKQLGTRRITVNAVSPGPTNTDMFRAGKSDELMKYMAGLNPQNRLGEPQDIAALVGFLVSEPAGWVNGQIIRANGGSA